jgi:hypothetical protein
LEEKEDLRALNS